MLSSSLITHHSRQLLVPEFTAKQQAALHDARILYIGAGGLGSGALPSLIGSGVGAIHVFDGDAVDDSNLARQTLYTLQDIGKNKAETIQQYLKARAVDVTITAHVTMFTEDHAAILNQVDLVLDGSDNLATRQLVNRLCVQYNKPLITAAVTGTAGYVFTIPAGGKPCYQCLFPENTEEQTCAATGVLTAMVPLIASWQSLAAIKVLTSLGASLSGRLQRYDALTNTPQIFTVASEPTCPICGLS